MKLMQGQVWIQKATGMKHRIVNDDHAYEVITWSVPNFANHSPGQTWRGEPSEFLEQFQLAK
jgi:hypothetical protein